MKKRPTEPTHSYGLRSGSGSASSTPDVTPPPEPVEEIEVEEIDLEATFLVSDGDFSLSFIN